MYNLSILLMVRLRHNHKRLDASLLIRIFIDFSGPLETSSDQ